MLFSFIISYVGVNGSSDIAGADNKALAIDIADALHDMYHLNQYSVRHAHFDEPFYMTGKSN